MEGELFSRQTTKSQGNELKHAHSIKPSLRTVDTVTSALSNDQSELYSQARSHWDEVPVGKYDDIT